MPSESAAKFNGGARKHDITGLGYNPALQMEVFKRKMWQNTRTCVNLVGVLINNASVRGLKTVAANNAAGNTAAQQYASEDKIIQMKPHRNDYAQQFPSVTLILNKTMTNESRAALEKWKQERIAEMGQEEFERFYQGKNFCLYCLH